MRGVWRKLAWGTMSSGGEPAALTLLDACIRLLPGVMGAEDGLAEESFEAGLLEYPLYTQPREWEDHPIPEVLLSGHHGRIREWRRQQAEEITAAAPAGPWDRYQVGRNEMADRRAPTGRPAKTETGR